MKYDISVMLEIQVMLVLKPGNYYTKTVETIRHLVDLHWLHYNSSHRFIIQVNCIFIHNFNDYDQCKGWEYKMFLVFFWQCLNEVQRKSKTFSFLMNV